MHIEFVNHASFLIRLGSVSLLCDPWLEGTAFNDSWALLSPTLFTIFDFERVTHLWHSHEHPDHFSPRALTAIPEATRERIGFLYQETQDGKVAAFAGKLGFPVQELPLGRWVELGPGLRAMVDAWRDGDSWICVTDGATTLLNLNDCAINTPEEARRVQAKLEGVPIDVLFTQFSLSAWEGNPEETERRRAGARTMLERAAMHARVFSPRFVVPFASFVWFCHEENAYMNPEMNRIDDVFRFLAAETPATPVVLYPGDEWEVGRPHDSEEAIRRYLRDADDVKQRPLARARQVPRDELVAASREFCGKLGSRSRLRLHLAAEAFRRREGSLPARVLDALRCLLKDADEGAAIYLWDHDAAYRFDVFRGLRPVELPREQCDVALGSESLLYAFQYLWGGATLQINGRFSEMRPGSREVFLRPFWLAQGLNQGVSMSWTALLQRRLSRRGRERAVASPFAPETGAAS